MKQELFLKSAKIKEFRERATANDNEELQEKKKKFLDWLIQQQIEIPQVLEMYPSNIYGKKQIPQYSHEVRFANTREQLASETRAEIDKIEFEKAVEILCEVMLSLIRKQVHFCVFYAKGQRSPHIIIYDFDELSELKPFHRIKAQAKFWRWIAPFSFHLFDHAIWDSEHYVPLEFSIHWKYGTPFELLFEYVPKNLPERKTKIKTKKIYAPIKKEKAGSVYYKSCIKCGSHSYLTQSNFYYCTNKECTFKEEKNAIYS